MKITHTYITKKTFDFEVANRDPFGGFKKFRSIREPLNLPVERFCFYCRKSFKDEDSITIAFIKGQKNRIIHEDCAKIVRLKDKEISK